MATKQEHKSKVDDRVRLKGQGQDALYESAYAGAEGWVEDQRHDDLGYPEIFVRWDRTHWTYNGEENGWTMESHFDILKDDMDHKDDKKEDVPKHVLDALAKSMGYDLVPSEEKITSDKDLEKIYNDVASNALEAISEGDAFIVIAVQKFPSSQGPMRAAEIFSAFKDEASQYLLEANISRIGSKAHERVVTSILTDLAEAEEKEKK